MEEFTEQWEPGQDVLKEVEVVGWEEMRQEIPSMTELRERWQEVRLEGADLDLEEALDLDVDEIPGSVSWAWGGVKVEPKFEYLEGIFGLFHTTKVGGWVRWCQGVEYPTCPQCKLLMTVPMLQLEEETEVMVAVYTVSYH